MHRNKIGLALIIMSKSLLNLVRSAVRILLVEDDTPLADVLARSLREESYAVDLATDGQEAVAAVSATVVDGQTLYATCIACHGADGAGNKALNAPRIAGQSGWYVARQLNNFKKGIRGSHQDDLYGKQMMPMAMGLKNDSEIEAIATYVNSLSGSLTLPTLDGDAIAGKASYVVCTACHGADGTGNQALNAPGLKGLPDWYLVRQLNNFKAGVRGGHADDVYGKQMMPMALGLDETAMKNLAAYITAMQ